MQPVPGNRSSPVSADVLVEHCRITRTVRVLEEDGDWLIERSCGERTYGTSDEDFQRAAMTCSKCKQRMEEVTGVSQQ
jgi:hypothetical protein